MKKNIFFLILIFGAIPAFGQNAYAKIITNQNDTINVTIKLNSLWTPDIKSFQEKLVTVENDGTKKEYLPADIKSYRVKYYDKVIEYESIDGKFFGELMYSNRLKLLKFIKLGYTNINFYIIKKPNNGKTLYMEAMGLSRLISKKTILREITDCQPTINKVETNELKINGEKGVIELVKDYEENCF